MCGSAIVAVALVQHIVVLGLGWSELRGSTFVIPASVGSFFGTLLVVVWRLRTRLAAERHALEAERARIQALLLQVEALAAERGDMVEEALDALEASRRAASAGLIAGHTAHDLANFLSVVNGGLGLLADGVPLEPGDAAAMQRAAERASVLARRLLRFVRDQAAHEPERVDLASVVHELQPVLERMLPVGQHLVVEPLEGTAWVDRFDLELAVMNLVGNARDASPQAARIELRTVHEGDEVVLEVVDHGEGMGPDQLAQTERPLFTTKGVGGTGLGLAIVRKGMDACGGRLELRSALGEGTTARLVMRAEAGASLTDGPPRPATRA